jgi:hypothetical protein
LTVPGREQGGTVYSQFSLIWMASLPETRCYFWQKKKHKTVKGEKRGNLSEKLDIIIYINML